MLTKLCKITQWFLTETDHNEITKQSKRRVRIIVSFEPGSFLMNFIWTQTQYLRLWSQNGSKFGKELEIVRNWKVNY